MAASSPQDDGLITAINVTPLVDVVLVLLIVLMVTANAIIDRQAIIVDLPEASEGVPPPQSPVTLTISLLPDGKLYLDGKEIVQDALRQKISASRADNSEVRAVLAADGAVAHRQVVQLIDLLRQEDVTKFAISVKPSDLETP